MTTAARVDETLARFNRKSPRDAYKQVCSELGIHYQRDIYNKLPEVPSAWHRIRTLELDGSLLGPKGCMSLLPIILVSTTLRKITLANCGLSDEFVIELCEILQSHPTVRSVDISNNELISVFAASSIISLMKNNTNMVGFESAGTHLGDNVANIISQLGARNRRLVCTYYVDNYFQLKNLFNYLDATGEGWVLLKSLIMNCPYPVLQEQFVERIAKVKPKKRSDNTISVNTFMSLVYMNYKTEGEIANHSLKPLDEPYIFMVANWKQILSAVERYNEDAAQQVVLPDDLHRIRLKDFLLTNEDADGIVKTAVKLQEDHDLDQNARQEGSEIKIDSLILLQAAQTGFVYPMTRPFYQFFQERDAAYVPEIMRNGSRLFDMSALASMGPSARSSNAGGDVDVDPEDPAHMWRMPSSVAKMAVDYFNQVYTKLPKKKESASAAAASPKSSRDKAMEKSAIPIESLLSVSFETDFETVKPALLANYYAQASLPIADSTITLQEMMNLLDELYVQITVDKVLSNDVIEAIENPFAVAEYADFLAEHLLGREDCRLQSIKGNTPFHPLILGPSPDEFASLSFFRFFSFLLFFNSSSRGSGGERRTEPLNFFFVSIIGTPPPLLSLLLLILFRIYFSVFSLCFGADRDMLAPHTATEKQRKTVEIRKERTNKREIIKMEYSPDRGPTNPFARDKYVLSLRSLANSQCLQADGGGGLGVGSLMGSP
eukprot:gene8050-5603_t